MEQARSRRFVQAERGAAAVGAHGAERAAGEGAPRAAAAPARQAARAPPPHARPRRLARQRTQAGAREHPR